MYLNTQVNIDLIHSQQNIVGIKDSLTETDYRIVLQYCNQRKHFVVNVLSYKTKSIYILNSLSSCQPKEKFYPNSTDKKFRFDGYFLEPSFTVKLVKCSQQEDHIQCFYFSTFFIIRLYQNLKNNYQSESEELENIGDIVDLNKIKYKKKNILFWKSLCNHIMNHLILIGKKRYIENNS